MTTADVVVVGSGAAGLSAAIAAHDAGADVVVLEKAAFIGGTTALSGGILWVPLNHHMADVGVSDSREDALRYLERVTYGRVPDPTLLGVYVDRAATILQTLEETTPLRCAAPSSYSDYYADHPGGRKAGRSVEPLPFPAAAIGEWAGRIQQSPFLLPVTSAELMAYGGPLHPELQRVVAERAASDIRVRGSALVAALLRAVLDRSIDVRVETAAERLLTDGEGTVTGVRAGPDVISASGGVVLASGGYEWNRAFTRAFLGHDVEPLTAPTNEGDGLRMAMDAGAALGNMSSYWGQPATVDPDLVVDGRPVLQFLAGRDRPGSIVVNRHGRRFVNEGAAYHDFVRAFRQFDPVTLEFPNEPPVWMVFDEAMRSRTVMMSLRPDRPPPSWLPSASTIEALAVEVGIDAAGLSSTVDRFNQHARNGEDPDFHRGTLWFEAFMADGPRPETCIAPIEQPPFYAIEVRNGTIGTNGGPRIDADARVLRADGSVITGLYAAGNVSACVFGPGYPGGGATIGPAVVFGTLAGRHAAGRRQLVEGHPVHG